MQLVELFEGMDDEADHWRAKRETGFYGAQGAGCLFFARDTGRFLIGERSTKPPPHHVEQPGTWGTFGGAIDRGEDPVDAIKREVREETSFTGPVHIEPMFVFKKGTFRYSNFLVVVEHEFKPRLNWEHESARWVEFGDWPSPLHFGMVSLLKDAASVATMQRYASEAQKG